MKILCRIKGHDWIARSELKYEQGKTMAYVGDDPEPREVGVTWVCDEVCARCGGESWWPT